MTNSEAKGTTETRSTTLQQHSYTGTSSAAEDRDQAAEMMPYTNEDDEAVDGTVDVSEQADEEEEEPVSEFSSGHYEVLSSYVVIVETKLIALTGTSLTLAALLLSIPPEGAVPLFLSQLSALLFGISALFGILAFFPRRYPARGSVIYWEDIQARASPAAYEADLAKITPTALEQDFTYQNYNISKALHFKYLMTRWCIIFLVAGLVAAFAAYALVSSEEGEVEEAATRMHERLVSITPGCDAS